MFGSPFPWRAKNRAGAAKPAPPSEARWRIIRGPLQKAPRLIYCYEGVPAQITGLGRLRIRADFLAPENMAEEIFLYQGFTAAIKIVFFPDPQSLRHKILLSPYKICFRRSEQEIRQFRKALDSYRNTQQSNAEGLEYWRRQIREIQEKPEEIEDIHNLLRCLRRRADGLNVESYLTGIIRLPLRAETIFPDKDCRRQIVEYWVDAADSCLRVERIDAIGRG